MLTRLLAIIRKEFIQIIRDPRSLYAVLLMPPFMLLLFGYAISFDVKHISTAVCDLDRTGRSREFYSSFKNSGYFDINYYTTSPKEIERLLDEGKVVVGIIIPDGFSRKLSMGEPSQIQVLLDGSNPNNATTSFGYIYSITQNYSSKLLISALSKLPKSIDKMPIDFRPRIWYNPELKSANFLVPGLIGIIMMVICVTVTAMAIVREKERGTMEQLIASPIQPFELIIGKALPYAIVAFADVVMILMLGRFVFNVPIAGNVFLLLALSILFLLGTLCVGLLISTVAESQQVAFMMATFTSMLPSFLLSGFIFPIKNMPTVVQLITYIVPARYFLVILRSIILKGAYFDVLIKETIFLSMFTVIMITLSALRWKKKM